MCTDDCPVSLLVLFRTGGKTPDPKLQVRSYVDVMLEQNLSKEEVRFTHSFSDLCLNSIWKKLTVEVPCGSWI